VNELRTERNHLILLDGLRGGAAIYVMIGHAIWLLSSPSVSAENRAWWEWIQVVLRMIFRYGHEAVLLFFVLSGLAIHLRLATSRVKGECRFDLWQYTRRRALRIYPPLIGAFIFTGVVDRVGQNINPIFYAAHSPFADLNDLLKLANYSFTTWVGNLLFIQSLVSPTLGTNGPLVSLSYEGFFYLFYPLLFVPLYLRYGRPAAFGVSLVLCALGHLVWFMTSVYSWSWVALWELWLAGALLVEMIVTGNTFQSNLLYLLTGFCLTILAMLYGRLPEPLNDLLWGSIWTLSIFALLQNEKSLASKIVQGLRFCAPFSYTLYLFHFPAFVLLSAWYINQFQTLPIHFGLVLGGIAISLVLFSQLAKPLERFH